MEVDKSVGDATDAPAGRETIAAQTPAPVLWPADFAALAPSLPAGSLKQTPAPGPASVVVSAQKTKCQFCKFFGTNLERHLLAKHSDKVSSKLRVKRAVFWANDISSESRGEVKGRCNEYAYQCGMRGRGAMVMRKTQHLHRNHKLTDAARLKEANAFFVTIRNWELYI